jgi:succinyl-CoA synthetase beta subunit
VRLFEYEAKRIFKTFDIPVPVGIVADSSKKVESAAKEVGFPVAIKAQVLVGGRGKAGGIRFANDSKDAVKQTEDLMNKKIRGENVKRVLVEKKLDVQREYYLAVTIDQLSGQPIVMFSTEGGVDVETLSKDKPELLISKHVDLRRGLFRFEATDVCKKSNLNGTLLLKASNILYQLYEVFSRYDAIIAEINPLVATREGEVFAVGAVLEIDDNSLFRHPEISIHLNERVKDKVKREAIKRGLTYVRLDGNIGVIGSGAGLTMTTIDLIKDSGMEPANFLETGGGITAELMEGAVEVVLKDKRLKALIINLYGGINPMPEAAKGIVKAYDKLRPNIPILVKLVGNQQEEACGLLERAGIPVVKEIQTEVAVEKLMSLLGE